MGSWTHKPEKRQAQKEARQRGANDVRAEIDILEPPLRTDGGPMTMGEMYGDGSNHEACQDCGRCALCGDCICAPNE